jgi:hypothetical protein
MSGVRVGGRAVRILLLVALIGSGACKDSSPEAGPASESPARAAAPPASWAQSVDPCTLLEPAEIEQVVGQPVADPVPNPGNAAICDFRFGEGGSIGVTTQDLRGGHTPERMMAELERRSIPVKETSGLGERSFFAQHPYGMTALNTFTNQRLIIIHLSLAGAAEARQEAVAEQLMRHVLSRL